MTASLNATQGSLLGFLLDGPKTGWDLLQEVERGLSRFWNVTSSHVYRELRNLEDQGFVAAGEPGARDRRPFSITATGKRAFRDWLAEPPGPEQIRFPLLVTLWFGRHLEPETLAGFVADRREDHAGRLAAYQDLAEAAGDADEHVRAVLDFGLAYEQAILTWLDTL